MLASEVDELEQHRGALTAYCYRMLGSPFEADDAVQETFLRAWRGLDRFEGRAAVSSWLYRIATNVCIDMLNGRKRRALPIDLGPAGSAAGPIGDARAAAEWVEPLPGGRAGLVGGGAADDDPAAVAETRETVRLAFVAALQQLPPRQRAALILCEVLRWQASEVAELLGSSVASVNSALQRARATLESSDVRLDDPAPPPLGEPERQLLARYLEAFEAYDMDALAALIKEDATQSMPPYELWLRGRDEILRWWSGPGAGCRGSRVVPAVDANGAPAFGQYRRDADGHGHVAWALQVVELEDGKVARLTFFLDTEAVFPLFGLPPRLDG